MFIFVWALTLLCCTRSYLVGASGMYNHPGGTRPDTVEAAIGTDFNITCFMNPKTFPTKNSSCLHFVIGRTNEELPWDNIVTISNTTIIYMVINASEQQAEYRCKCGLDAITETKVYVGSLPRPVTDFSCSSYDFDHMICNFTKPHNPILTTYNVSYYNEFQNYIYLPKCNYNDRNLVICNTSLRDRYQEIYHFIIEGSNALVKTPEERLLQNFDINNFEIMIPAKPGDNMHVESLTVNSIKLSWQMPNWDKYRLKGLQWEVLLKPENSTAVIQDDPVRDHNIMRLRLNNLPYSYWNYNLKIRVRVKNSAAAWSEPFEYKFRTDARLPQRPPRIDPGSFYIDSTETRMTVYWEELLPHEYNGDNFTYVIYSIAPDGKTSNLTPWHQEKNLAKFYFRKDLYYHFEIRSRNHMGESNESSILIIYPKSQRNLKDFTPQAIHNVYHGNNGTYTLTWSKPKNLTQLLSFTVFWCYPKRALPNECKESMHFQQVPSNQLNYTTHAQNASEERILNLAVSANYYKFNTGLHWTDCSMDIVNTDLVKMEPELIANANSIKMQWSVERVCPSILDGFNITYCEIANNVVVENATCLHNKVISKLAMKYDKKFIIDNLKPFTAYKVSMLMFWRTKRGQPSDAQIVRTLEGAPSPPRQLRVENITNTTATIKWLEPTHPNGKIRKYIIMLNNDQIEVNATILTYNLENLECFTAYKVYVLAETIERSETSNDVHFTTAIGIPSPPGIGANNNVANIIQWSKPLKPSGPIDFYEVQVSQFQHEELLRHRINIVMDGTSCSFVKLPTCVDAEYKTTVMVRAVNAVLLSQNGTTISTNASANKDDSDDLQCWSTNNKPAILEKYSSSLYHFYKSDWQTSAIFSCASTKMNYIIHIILGVAAVLAVITGGVYLGLNEYRKMANIKCTLPLGLEICATKQAVKGFSVDFVCGSQSIKETRAAEDEWLKSAGIHDFNLRNEHHHLLSSLGHSEANCLGGTNPNDNIFSSVTETAHICAKDSANAEEMNVRYEKESPQPSTSSSTDTLADDTTDCESNNLVLEHPALGTAANNNNDYVKQSMSQPGQFVNNTNAVNHPCATNGYITVQNLSQALANPLKNPSADFRPTAGGYVMQQDLQNLFANKSLTNPAAASSAVPNTETKAENSTQQFNSNGYTTFENLSKLCNKMSANNQQQEQQQQQPNEFSNSNLQSMPLNTANPADNCNFAKPGVISGYVTQHDLNLFAQQHHNY